MNLPQSTLVPLRCFRCGLRGAVHEKYSLSMMRQIPAINTIKYSSTVPNGKHLQCFSVSVSIEMSWYNLEKGHFATETRGELPVIPKVHVPGTFI